MVHTLFGASSINVAHVYVLVQPISHNIPVSQALRHWLDVEEVLGSTPAYSNTYALHEIHPARAEVASMACMDSRTAANQARRSGPLQATPIPCSTFGCRLQQSG